MLQRKEASFSNMQFKIVSQMFSTGKGLNDQIHLQLKMVNITVLQF